MFPYNDKTRQKAVNQGRFLVDQSDGQHLSPSQALCPHSHNNMTFPEGNR